MRPESAPPTASAVLVSGRAPGAGSSAAGHDLGWGAARLLGVTSLAHFLNDGIVFFVPVVGDLLVAGRHTSTPVVTAMLTIFYVTSACFGIVVGLRADRIGRRATMIAFGIAALGTSLLGFYAAFVVHGAQSDALVVAAALVAGIGSSFYHPLGGSLLQLGFPEGARGRALGVNGAFGSLGRALYPALFFVVAALGVTKPATTAVFGGLSLLAAGIVLAELPELARGSHRQEHRPRRAGLHPATTGPTGASAPDPSPDAPASRVRSGALRSLLTRSV